MNLQAVLLLGPIVGGCSMRAAEAPPAVATLPAAVRRMVFLGDSSGHAGERNAHRGAAPVRAIRPPGAP